MSKRVARNVLLFLAACGLAGVLAVAVAAAAGPRQSRLGAPPPHPRGSAVLGALPSTTPLNVTVTLKPRDPAALAAYATAVSTPGSGVYHRYLTVAEFRQRFGPTSAQIASVLASLRAHGLEPGHLTANGLAIPVRASTGALSRAFSTSFQRVALRGGRRAFANTEAPSLAPAVAAIVQGVIGLNSLAIPRPLDLHAGTGRRHVSRHVLTGGPQPCATATSAASGSSAYTADQLASAYGLPGLHAAGDQGAGQTVAIFELENNFNSDITAFKSCYGITTGSVSYNAVDGGPGTPSVANQDGVETELDIENVIGLAPKANVTVYQGPYYQLATDANVYDTYNAMISNSSVNVISTSWGLCEQADPSGAQSESTLFQEAATQGQSVFAAAGDSGSEDCGDNSLAVDDPASQPYVTGAGGTSLTTPGTPPTESVWNDQCSSGPCGGGGGISTLWQMQSYQSGAPAGLNVINSKSSRTPCSAPSGKYCREVPDVSADADPGTGYLIYWHGDGTATDSSAWQGIGGTSGAAPLWAGLMADVNASTACNGTPIGFANPALYGAAANAYSSDFNDITSGNNALSGTGQTLFPAGIGYDMASGLGTPNAYPLATTLCGNPVHIAYPGTQASQVSGSSPSVQLQISATDTGGKTLTYSATGLPAGVTINAASGLISGSPTIPGAYDVTVTVTASDGPVNTVGFMWTISTPVALSNPGAQTSVASRSVSLQLTGSGSGLTYSATGLPTGLSIDPASGLISGNATTPGTYTVTAGVTDGTYSDSAQFTWTVNPVTVSVTNPGNQVAIVNVATSLQPRASENGAGTLVYSATGLPAGLAINSTSGLISGTPTVAGTYSVTLTSTDGPYSGSAQFAWIVSAAVVAVANPGNQTAGVGTRVSLQLHAADNNGGALSYRAAGLPAGLSINTATGLISGTPSSPGTSSVTVAAADGGSSASVQFTWTIGGHPTSGSSALAGIAAGKPKLGLALSAGIAAPAIKKVSLTLPNGLTFTRKVSKGVSLTGMNGKRLKGFKLKVSGRKLTITLAQAVTQIRIAIGPPAISASRGLVAKVRHKSAGKLTVTLTATDASGQVTSLPLKLKPS